jgi:hypothetical protein
MNYLYTFENIAGIVIGFEKCLWAKEDGASDQIQFKLLSQYLITLSLM